MMALLNEKRDGTTAWEVGDYDHLNWKRAEFTEQVIFAYIICSVFNNVP